MNKEELKEEIKQITKYPRAFIDFSPRIPPLKKMKDKSKIDVRYCLIAPFAYTHIHWDPLKYEVLYDLEEPVLNDYEKECKEKIITTMREMINFDEVIKSELEPLLDYIDKRLKFLAVELGMSLSYDSYRKIFYYLCRDFIGFNETDPLLKDYFVEDVECNGMETPVYLVHRVFRTLKTNLIFKENQRLESFVEKLAQRCGKYISYAQPILDGSLPDGSRVNATYTKDITNKGPTFTIRKFTKTPWTPTQLLSFNTLSPEMLAYLWLLVEHKMNILIAGGTSSGKTSLLNAIAFFIPPEARVVSIEDTLELNLPRDNWLPSVARASTSGRKEDEIDLFTLLRSSFRQNPEYVIVGEVRGAEASVLFQGMASGHSSISTMHAESVDTVIKRLETPPIELSPTLLNVLDAVCIMTHATVNKQETRKLREIVEIINVASDGVATTNTPVVWNPSDDQFYFKRNIKSFEKISKRSGLNLEEINLEFRKRVQLLYVLYRKNIFGFTEVQEIINRYYKQPEKVLKDFEIMF
ncbi:MAG: type II/IV secretion system ATPase subunit [archaeon]